MLKVFKEKYKITENILYVIKNIRLYDSSIFVLLLSSTIVTSVAPFASIIFPRFILAELLEGKRINVLIILLLSFFIFSSISSFLIHYLKGVYSPRITSVRYSFMNEFYKKCLETDFENTEDATFLNDMQTARRCLQRNDTGFEGVINTMFSLANNGVTLIFAMTIIATLDIRILLYLFANVSLIYFMTLSTKKFEYKKKDAVSDAERRVSYIKKIMYDFAYGKEVRIFSLSDWIQDLYTNQKQKEIYIQKEINQKRLKTDIISFCLFLFRDVVVYIFLIYSVMNGNLSIPDFLMYLAIIMSFSGWLQNFMINIAYMQSQNMDLNHYRNFMEREEKLQSIEKRILPSPPYTIEFKNVYFSYPKSEDMILRNINIKINHGEKLAIVGRNGAGKSTFIKLIMRLYDCSKGEILLNGINIKNFDLKEYYSLIATVFQEIKPLAFTIYENIAIDFNNQNVNEEKIKEIAKKVGIFDKISILKKGLDTNMLPIMDDDGIQFSGGEAQKIMIARALYKNAEIMILDEPTSALDPISERDLYKKFNEITIDKTTIFISHRLASTHFCDTILLFDHGQIIERGTHKELLEKNGKYAEMFQIQSQYYSQEVEI